MKIRPLRNCAIAPLRLVVVNFSTTSYLVPNFLAPIFLLTLILMTLSLGACGTPGNVEQLEVQSSSPQDELMTHETRGQFPIQPVVLADILFEFEQSIFHPEAKYTLDRAAVFLAQNPTMIASVEGHTDHSGDDFHNQILSVERARAVKLALVARGVARSQIKTDGLGESRPFASNHTVAGRKANRRVEIVFRR